MHLAKASLALILLLSASAVAQPTVSGIASGTRLARPQDPRLVSESGAHLTLRHALRRADSDRSGATDGSIRLRTSESPSLRLSTLSQNWSGAVWEDGGQVIYIHNADGSLAQTVWQDREKSGWRDGYRDVYRYVDGDLVEELGQFPSGEGWVDADRLLYTYTDGHVTEWLDQVWTESWFNYRRMHFTYDGEGRYVHALMQSWMFETEWQDVYRYVFSYTGSGALAEVLEESWNGSTWESSYRESYEYDAEDRLSVLTTQLWYGGGWINEYRERYTYAAGALVEALSQVDYDGLWEDIYRIAYANDAEGNALEELGQYFVEGAWFDAQRDLHTYAQVTAGEAAAPGVERFAVSVYPNPTHDDVRAVFALEGASSVEWALYDLIGRRVAAGVPQVYGPGDQVVRLPLDGMPAGTYVLQVRSEGIAAAQRLTIIR